QFIGLVQWLLGGGGEVMAGYIGAHTHEIETEDLGMGMLKFKNGAAGTVLGTTTFPKSPYAGVELNGEEAGALHLFHDEPTWYFLDDQRQPPDVTPSVRSAAEDMVRALRDGTPVAVNGREGRKSLAILAAIYTSAREKRPVRIEQLR